MALLFQVLILPVALHLNSLGGPENLDLTVEDTSLCVPEQLTSKRLCDAKLLRSLCDGNVHRDLIEDFLASQTWSPLGGQQLESTVRALVSEMLFIYDAAVTRALEKGCIYAHMLALLVSMLRVHILLLAVGLVQDICSSLIFCSRMCLQRLLAPLCEAWGLLDGLCRRVRRERPVVPRKMLSVLPVSVNAAAVRRRTRAALEALATSEALAKAGLQPEDVSCHAAELNYIQERCHPMREKEKGDWWLAEESLKTSLAVQRPVRCSDLLGILGILLPLPCTVLLAEELLAAQEVATRLPGALLGLSGLGCAASVGLLSGGPLAWPHRLLLFLQLLLAALGVATASSSTAATYATFSAALLASVELRRVGSAVPWSLRRRQRLSGVFAVAFLAAAALLRWARLEEASEAWLAWKALRSGHFCDAKYGPLLGLPFGALSVLLTCFNGKGRCFLASGVLLAISMVLLMHTGQAGLVAALWWLSFCEAVSVSWHARPEWAAAVKTRLEEPAQAPMTSGEERKARDTRLAARQRSSSLPRVRGTGGA